MKKLDLGILKMEEMPQLEEKDIVCVYSGKPNMCMCGCSGKYYYSSENAEIGSKQRGYEVSRDDISDRMVRKVIGILKENKENNLEVILNGDGYIFSCILNNRSYVIYTKE